MQTIAFFGTKPWEEKYLSKKLKEAALDLAPVFVPQTLSKEHLPEDKNFSLCSVFVDSMMDKVVIEALPNLKFIVTRSTGYDHIDLKAASERGIVVASVPSYGENTVAEYAFALLLTLSRKIYEGAHRVREETKFSFEGLQGFDLRGKKI
jgi:D-lactate dehydrogenase